MTASATPAAFGSTFTWDRAVIAELIKIGGVKLSVKTTDITSFDSDDGYKEVIPTILDGGSFDIEGFLSVSDTLGQVAALTDFHAKSKKQWIITFPTSTGTTWTGYGYLTAFETGDLNVDGVLTFKATIENTGKPALAIAASTGGTFVVTGNNGAGVVNPVSAAGVY
jgi:predicted secreted protein